MYVIMNIDIYMAYRKTMVNFVGGGGIFQILCVIIGNSIRNIIKRFHYFIYLENYHEMNKPPSKFQYNSVATPLFLLSALQVWQIRSQKGYNSTYLTVNANITKLGLY